MSAKNSKITVQGCVIEISSINNNDYISLTDMVKGLGGDDLIRNWMRNKNTIEFLGVWEQLHNSDFKGVEFDTFLNEAGLNRFNMTPRKWIDATNAIGIISKSGRNGGTYAHKDIAFEFGAWISPIFKLYLITEYQRLKEYESKQIGGDWEVKRVLSKVNYGLHTDAIKNNIIPIKSPPIKDEWVYAEEADILNIALFGCTARDWRLHNPTLAKKGLNIRDVATIEELTVLSILETYNSVLIKQGIIDKKDRLPQLQQTAIEQLDRIKKISLIDKIKNQHDTRFIGQTKSTPIDDKLNQALNYNPKKDNRNDNECEE